MGKIFDKKFIRENFPDRNPVSNKGDYGRILNIAGSKNYSGAAYLSSFSALKTGAGYVTLACPDNIVSSIASLSPEITFIPLHSTKVGSISENNNIIDTLKNYDVVSIGCGLTTEKSTEKFVMSLFHNFTDKQKVVVDADAINILAHNQNITSLKGSVITPHPKELSRLLNVDIFEINTNREKYARIASQTYQCVTVLKGHNTIITDGDKIFVNLTGNSALAKAGTGDVLTGIISALLAQGVPTFNAAIVGVYLHGLAGDLASQKLTQYSVVASDVIDYIPNAINKIINDD